jgi:hypothetical protein
MTSDLRTSDSTRFFLKEQRGRALLMAIFGSLLLIDLIAILTDVSQHGGETIISSIIQASLTIALMYAVWIGQRWARWLFVGLVYTAALMVLPSAISRPSILLVGALLVFALAGSLVGFSGGIGSFLRYQRDRRG